MHLSELEVADRIEIFRHLAVDDSDVIDSNILGNIAISQFHAFVNFCDEVFAKKDLIDDVYYDPTSIACFKIRYRGEHEE